MSETGVVKFSCEHVAVELGPFRGFAELNDCRQKLRQLGVLGVDSDGIGFGNVSLRHGLTSKFFITGSGTGGLPELTLKDYARVTACDFERNWLRCEGATIASAESLTHAAVYHADRGVGAIIHGHDAELWMRLRNRAPASAPEVEYGTPQMAREVARLFAETDVRERKLFVMEGHADGFVVFGADLREALGVLATQIPPKLSS